MNVQNRVNELLEKDEIEKQRQLKEVEDFYRDIEEDLMVACLYYIERFGFFAFDCQTNYGTTDAKSFTKIEGLYSRTSEFTNNEIFEENIKYIRGLTMAQGSRFMDLFKESISGIDLILTDGKNFCSHYSSIIITSYSVVKNDCNAIIKEEVSMVQGKSNKFKLNIPLTCLLCLVLVILLIIVFIPVK